MGRRVFSAMVKHQTNTFSRLATGLDAFRARALRGGGAIEPIYRDTNSELAAHFDAADEFGWDLVCALAANATPSGRVTAQAWDYITDALFTALEHDGPFDGILLALNGAMVTETIEDGEGALLEALRQRVGPDIPICVSLDLHANVTEQMAANANGLFSYRTYPHVDTYDTAKRAAAVLNRAMDGDARPRCLVARRPQIEGANYGRGQSGPMVDLIRRCLAHGEEPGILDVSVNAGFPWSDIEAAGPSVTVTYGDDGARAREIAEAMMDTIWDQRAEVTLETVSAAEAIARVVAAGPGEGPFVLADYADNPGGGSYGDNPVLLEAMLDAGFENAAFATICDPDAVITCQRAGVRGTVTLSLGGKYDPATKPYTLTGEVVAVSEGGFTFEGPMMKGLRSTMGNTVVLRVGGMDIVISSARVQSLDRAVFRSQGIDPETKSVIGVKSAHHFRAGFEPIAREILLVNAGGLTTPDLKSLSYKNVRRPVWPLDDD